MKSEVYIHLSQIHLNSVFSQFLTFNVDGGTVISTKTVKEIGATLNPDPSFDEHIKTVSRTAFSIYVTLQKSETFCPKIMQKNVSMLLSLLG